jgi:hypothetical protein
VVSKIRTRIGREAGRLGSWEVPAKFASLLSYGKFSGARKVRKRHGAHRDRYGDIF